MQSSIALRPYVALSKYTPGSSVPRTSTPRSASRSCWNGAPPARIANRTRSRGQRSRPPDQLVRRCHRAAERIPQHAGAIRRFERRRHHRTKERKLLRTRRGRVEAREIRGAAHEAVDDFLGKVQVWKDQAGERVDEEKTKKRLSDIQDAVGRPVTKVILDKQDKVVLNLGDIITHTSIQSAYDAGMLDTLLDSVYKGDVTFTRDEMRAPVEAEATVDKASGGAAVVDQMEQKVEQAQQERDQKREEGRAEAEQKREENRQEREQKAQQREQGDQQGSASAGGSVQNSGQESRQQGGDQARFSTGGSRSAESSGLDAPTQEHEQVKISDEEFQRGSKNAGQGGSSGGSF